MEDAVRAVEKAYDDAWRAGDMAGLLACLTSDAVLVNPYGAVASGRPEIRRELTSVLRDVGTASVHTSVISRVGFVTSGVAVVDGEAFLGDAGSEGSAPAFHHHFTDVLVRRDDEWLIAHIRAYRLFEPAGR